MFHGNILTNTFCPLYPKIIMSEKIVLFFFIVCLDIAIFLYYILLFIQYEETIGDDWNLADLDFQEQVILITLSIWHFLHLALFVYALYKIITFFGQKIVNYKTTTMPNSDVLDNDI